METLIDWLREAREEIIAGLVLALLGWLYKALFKKKEQTDTDIQQVLKDLEEQRRKEAERRAELELELEQKRHEEALRAAEAQKEEARKLEESLQHNQFRQDSFYTSDGERQNRHTQPTPQIRRKRITQRGDIYDVHFRDNKQDSTVFSVQ